MGLRFSKERPDCLITLWSARPYGKIYYCQASVSSKNKDTGEYTVAFSGTITLAGKAAEKVATFGLPEKSDRAHPMCKVVRVTSIDITSYYNKKKLDELLPLCRGDKTLEYFVKERVNQYTFTVWDIETDIENKGGAQKTAKKEEGFMAVPDSLEDEGLPFN